MRNHRVALIVISYAAAVGAAAFTVMNTGAAAPATTQETAASWTMPLPHDGPLPTQLLTTQSLQPLATFAAAVTAAQLQRYASSVAAAQAASAAAAQAAPSPTAPSTATTYQTAPSPPEQPAVQTTDACGLGGSAPTLRAEAAGVPCAWVPTAVCEEGGNDDSYAGYFGILEWQGFGGYPQAGAAPLQVQLGWEAAHGQGPPDAPGQCHDY